MTKKLIILFLAIGVARVGWAQGVSQSYLMPVETPPSAYSAQTPPGFALRTNLLYWGGAFTPNLGVEFGLTTKMTLSVIGAWNYWGWSGSVSGEKGSPEYKNNLKLLNHFVIEPEVRYWLCERFNGHSFGAHLILSGLPKFGKNGSDPSIINGFDVAGRDIPPFFKISVTETKPNGDKVKKQEPLLFAKEKRYTGAAIGAGVSYNYHWMLAKKIGVEFSVGVGFLYLKYVKSNCEKCGEPEQTTTGDPFIYSKTYLGPTKLGINLIYLIK